MACNSPAHKAYRDAMETLYVQTWLARNDLDKLVKEAWAEGEAAAPGVSTGIEKGTALHLREHKLDEVVERIRLGQQEVADATAKVNAHFDRGCKNLVEVA